MKMQRLTLARGHQLYTYLAGLDATAVWQMTSRDLAADATANLGFPVTAGQAKDARRALFPRSPVPPNTPDRVGTQIEIDTKIWRDAAEANINRLGSAVDELLGRIARLERLIAAAGEALCGATGGMTDEIWCSRPYNGSARH